MTEVIDINQLPQTSLYTILISEAAAKDFMNQTKSNEHIIPIDPNDPWWIFQVNSTEELIEKLWIKVQPIIKQGVNIATNEAGIICSWIQNGTEIQNIGNYAILTNVLQKKVYPINSLMDISKLPQRSLLKLIVFHYSTQVKTADQFAAVKNTSSW